MQDSATTAGPPSLPTADSRLWRRTFGLFEPKPGTLLSPAADVLMAGGASIVLFVILKIFTGKTADTTAWSAALYYAAFLVNYPHFAASYQLLYQDAGRDFFAFRTRPWFALKLWWAGVVVPLLLLGWFVFALSRDSTVMLGYIVNAMFFFVGWHYVKQIFGCVVVLSAARKIFYTKWERWIILAPLYAIWLMQFAAVNKDGTMANYVGIPYTHIQMPMAVVEALILVFILTSLGMVAMFGWRFANGKPLPPLSAVVALLSIYVWFTPVYSCPYYLLIIPFFHSLQYLLFVLVYKRNESVKAAPEPNAERGMTAVSMLLFLALPVVLIAAGMLLGATGKLEDAMIATYGMLMTVSSSLWMRTAALTGGFALVFALLQLVSRRSAQWHFLNFIAQMLLLGALIFSLVPTALDILAKNALLPHALIYNSGTFGTTLYFFAFIVFVNIHHYFIDNVLWRRDNPNVREYLHGH